MVINKKVKRAILESKSRYIGSMVLVLLSCLLFTSFNIAGPSIKESVDEFREKKSLEDANFSVFQPIGNPSELESKFNLVLEGRKSVDYAYDPDSTLRVMKETKKLNRYAVVQGKGIEKDDEVVLDKNFARAHNLGIGDVFEIDGKEFRIAGFITLPDYLYLLKSENDFLPNADAFGISMVSPDAFEGFGKGTAFYSVKFNENNVDEFKEFLNENFVLTGWTSKEDNPRISTFNGDIRGFIEMGKVVPITILILSCILVAVILWRRLKVEFVEIGTLYAMGYRKKEILKHYLSYALMIALVGSVLGTLLGMVTARPLEIVQSVQYNLPVIQYQYKAVYLILSTLLPFVFIVPTCAFVIMRALRMAPLELMRGGANKTKVGFLERKLNLRRLGFDTKFRIREILRNIPRTLVMILGVTFASALLLFGFVTNDSIDFLLKDQYNNVYQYNYSYMFNTLKTEKITQGEKLSAAPFTLDRRDGKGEVFTIYGIQKDAKLIQLENKKGEVLGFDKVIVTRSLANALGIDVKDTVKVKSKINAKEFEITIDHIAESYIGNYIYMPIDAFNEACGYPEGSYGGVLAKERIDFDPGSVASVVDKQDMTEGFEGMVKPLRYMLVIVAMIALVIGIIVIYIVTSMVIEENKSNISLLKVLGYSKKKIYSLILNSNTVLVVAGYILSVPLILLAVNEFFEIITSEMNMTVPAQINRINIVLGFVIMMGTYELSKLLSRKKVIDISMADSLKSRME